MTLVLELSPEVENELRQTAVNRNVSVEIVAIEALSEFAQRVGRLTRSEEQARRLAALSKLGTYDTRQQVGLAPTNEADDERSALYDDGVDQVA